MKVVLLSLAAVLAWPNPTAAQVTSPLWKNINSGMTYADVQALYPAEKGKVQHKGRWISIQGVAEIGKCHPTATINFSKDGHVSSVWLEPRRAWGGLESCVEDALAALIAKYGDPTLSDGVPLTPLTGPTYTWRLETVTVRMERRGSSEWTIIYEPTKPADV